MTGKEALYRFSLYKKNSEIETMLKLPLHPYIIKTIVYRYRCKVCHIHITTTKFKSMPFASYPNKASSRFYGALIHNPKFNIRVLHITVS